MGDLKALLKKKGIGPTMSKSLTEEDLQRLTLSFQDPEEPLTTKATMLTALLTLESTDEEAEWLKTALENPAYYFPKEIIDLIPNTPISSETSPALAHLKKRIQSVIQHQSLNKADMIKTFSSFYDPEIPDYAKAAFLEAERLKGETQDENTGCFEVMWTHTEHRHVNVPLLIDLSNAYDGLNRTPLLSPFVAAILGHLEYPTLVHGVKEVAPKKAQTAHKLLLELGITPLASIEDAIHRLENPSIGWAYLDQSQFSPQTYAALQLRTDMVKRPVLATMEKLMQPLSGQENLLVTGYTHPPYKDKMKDLLIKQNKQNRVMIVRGVEGSAQLPLDRRCPCIQVINGTVSDLFIRPADFGFTEEQPPFPDPVTDEWVAQEGLKVLAGEESPLKAWILYQVAAIVHVGLGVPIATTTQRLQSIFPLKLN